MYDLKDRLTKLEVEMTTVIDRCADLDKKIDGVCIKLDNLKLWIMGVLAGIVGTMAVHFLV